MIAPFKTWHEVLLERKRAEAEADLEDELAAMRARLAAMADNDALAKLKLFFSMKMGQMKALCWKAIPNPEFMPSQLQRPISLTPPTTLTEPSPNDELVNKANIHPFV